MLAIPSCAAGQIACRDGVFNVAKEWPESVAAGEVALDDEVVGQAHVFPSFVVVLLGIGFTWSIFHEFPVEIKWYDLTIAGHTIYNCC